MKVLFALHYPGYLRYYDSVVLELARRGHSVAVTFSRGRQSEGMRALEGAGERVTRLRAPPKRDDPWGPVAQGLYGLVDYLRYLHPLYPDSSYLRRRQDSSVPSLFSFMTRLSPQHPGVVRLAQRVLLWLVSAVPSSPQCDRFIADAAPDVVVVSPLVANAARQPDLIKSAHALGIPAVLGVASWDHLTTKGLIKMDPERVIVWNEIQRAEAQQLHHVAPDRIAVTGAQPFDRWFDRRPTLERQAFCRKVGLPDDRPFALFVGSTRGISGAPRAEPSFVREWVQALRSSGDPAVAGLRVLVRPHPYNADSWNDADLAGLDGVALWPRAGANPVDEGDRADYFDSLFHSAAIVGINTSAMIEAAIVGTPVFTVRSPRFSPGQQGRLHFRYMLPENGGFLRVAASLTEHTEQLSDVLASPEPALEQISRFVRHFVRPQGLDLPSTPRVADVIEEVAAGPARRPPSGLAVRAMRHLLWAIALEVQRRAPSPVPAP